MGNLGKLGKLMRGAFGADFARRPQGGVDSSAKISELIKAGKIKRNLFLHKSHKYPADIDIASTDHHHNLFEMEGSDEAMPGLQTRVSRMPG